MNLHRLAVAGTLLATSAAGAFASESNTIVPLVISQGFNVDIIAEALPVAEHADFVFDSYYAFYTTNVVEEDVEINAALTTPDNHTLVTKDGITFELAAFDGKNALHADTKNTEYTLRFSEGINADKLYVLCNSNSSRTMMATIYYSDNTESSEFELEVSSAKYASYNKDEFAITDKLIIDEDEYTTSKYYGFNVFELAADESKEAVAVSFYCNKNPQFFVYAVSASADVSGTSIKIQPSVKKLNIAPFTTEEIILSYDFNGEERAANFGCSAAVSDSCIAVGEITENTSAATFTIPVEALAETGAAELTITVTNGDFSKKCIIPVKIAKPSLFLGWTHDVIAEGLPSNEKVTAPLDESGWALYTAGVKEEGAIAGADGVVTTTSGTTFQLQPYDEPNAIKLSQNVPATLEMAKPTECKEVRILAISANGDATVNVKAAYTDGTQSETSTITIPDWYGDATDTAIHGVDRVFTKTNDWDYDLDAFDGRFSFRLYEFTLATDPARKLESVTFESTKRKVYPTIIALAVNTDGITGISPVSNSGRCVEGIYSIQGVRVENPGSGLFIVRYTDGSVEKVIIR